MGPAKKSSASANNDSHFQNGCVPPPPPKANRMHLPCTSLDGRMSHLVSFLPMRNASRDDGTNISASARQAGRRFSTPARACKQTRIPMRSPHLEIESRFNAPQPTTTAPLVIRAGASNKKTSNRDPRSRANRASDHGTGNESSFYKKQNPPFRYAALGLPCSYKPAC